MQGYVGQMVDQAGLVERDEAHARVAGHRRGDDGAPATEGGRLILGELALQLLGVKDSLPMFALYALW
jgi:hypothetical protein